MTSYQSNKTTVEALRFRRNRKEPFSLSKNSKFILIHRPPFTQNGPMYFWGEIGKDLNMLARVLGRSWYQFPDPEYPDTSCQVLRNGREIPVPSLIAGAFRVCFLPEEVDLSSALIESSVDGTACISAPPGYVIHLGTGGAAETAETMERKAA